MIDCFLFWQKKIESKSWHSGNTSSEFRVRCRNLISSFSIPSFPALPLWYSQRNSERLKLKLDSSSLKCILLHSNPPTKFLQYHYLSSKQGNLPAPPTSLNPPPAPIRSWSCPLRQRAASGAVPLSHLQGETSSNKTEAETR